MTAILTVIQDGRQLDACLDECYSRNTPRAACLCGGHNGGLGFAAALAENLQRFPEIMKRMSTWYPDADYCIVVLPVRHTTERPRPPADDPEELSPNEHLMKFLNNCKCALDDYPPGLLKANPRPVLDAITGAVARKLILLGHQELTKIHKDHRPGRP